MDMLPVFQRNIKLLESVLNELNAYKPCVSTVGMIYLISAESNIKSAIEAIKLMEQFKDSRKS